MLGKNKGIPALAGFAVACLDETIQRFVPGRGPSFLDVGIDTLGVVMGMMLLMVGYDIQKLLFGRNSK